MPGLLRPLKTCARRLSLPLLAVQLVFFVLLAFGHHCDASGLLTAPPRAQYLLPCGEAHLLTPAAEEPPAEHVCLACILERDGTAVLPVPSPSLTGALQTTDVAPAVPSPSRGGTLLTASPRGPPHA